LLANGNCVTVGAREGWSASVSSSTGGSGGTSTTAGTSGTDTSGSTTGGSDTLVFVPPLPADSGVVATSVFFTPQIIPLCKSIKSIDQSTHLFVDSG
jgi:hypothetical protein